MANKLTRAQYVERYWKDAVQACQGTRLFPSVMLAQGILESGNGNSSLSRLYHNHFGIKKGTGWKGKVVNLKTREVFDGKSTTIVDGFRVYDTSEQGFRDRNEFLSRNPRYTKAGVFAAKSAEEQTNALAKAGYATDPDYAKKLNSIIHANNLKQYDPQ
jgi:flagellum-specific peptidoglycan hydrolase FlgJ